MKSGIRPPCLCDSDFSSSKSLDEDIKHHPRLTMCLTITLLSPTSAVWDAGDEDMDGPDWLVALLDTGAVGCLSLADGTDQDRSMDK